MPLNYLTAIWIVFAITVARRIDIDNVFEGDLNSLLLKSPLWRHIFRRMTMPAATYGDRGEGGDDDEYLFRAHNEED